MKKPRKLRLRKRVTKSYQAMVNPWPRVETRIDVHDAMLELPPELQQAVELCFIGKHSQANAAKLMQVSDRTIRSYLTTALLLLSNRL